LPQQCSFVATAVFCIATALATLSFCCRSIG